MIVKIRLNVPEEHLSTVLWKYNEIRELCPKDSPGVFQIWHPGRCGKSSVTKSEKVYQPNRRRNEPDSLFSGI